MGMENREGKESLFQMIFGSEENQTWAQDLLRGIGGVRYEDANLEDVCTGDHYLYLGSDQGVSLLMAEPTGLFDETTALNPNTPFLMMEHMNDLYSRLLEGKEAEDAAFVSLPLLKLVGLYHGTKEDPEERVLYLQDAFEEGAEADISVKVRMLNLHEGKNKELMEKCRPLSEYAWFVKEVREILGAAGEEKKQGLPVLEAGIDMAMRNMPRDFVIRNFLQAHLAEVKAALFLSYEEEAGGKMILGESK